MTQLDDQQYMARALTLAKRGLFGTDPNPRVGCVLVQGDVVVGEGWHERAGGPHAEINALQQAGDRAKGATAYISLEPCCHQGRTPACTEALIAAGVSRVVAAMQDPNPIVAGQGLQRLRESGIETVVNVLEAQARDLNPGFVQRMEHRRPFVRCKLAMSLDGRTAMASGESKWITGEAARHDVQRLRARSSAIVTGIGTVLSDDPSLNVRLIENDKAASGSPESRQPLRVVLDSRLRMPASAKMLALPGKTLVLTASTDAQRTETVQQSGAEVVVLTAGPDGIDLAAVMAELVKRECNEVLIESGSVLCGALLRAGFIDELIIYMAPHLMGDNARGLFHLPGLERMEQRINITIQDVRSVGKDLRLTCVVAATGS